MAKTQMRFNAEGDPSYRPYCLACPTMARMRIVEPMFWRCSNCGAEHDERSPSGASPNTEARDD